MQEESSYSVDLNSQTQRYFARQLNSFSHSFIHSFIFFSIQTSAPITGGTSEDTATKEYRPAIHGATARVSARYWGPIFPVSTAKRKMYLHNPYTVEKMAGLVCPTSTAKERLFGVTGLGWTSLIGPRVNQTTFTMKIVYTLLVFSRITNTSGMLWIVQVAISTAVRKVWFQRQFFTVLTEPIFSFDGRLHSSAKSRNLCFQQRTECHIIGRQFYGGEGSAKQPEISHTTYPLWRFVAIPSVHRLLQTTMAVVHKIPSASSSTSKPQRLANPLGLVTVLSLHWWWPEVFLRYSCPVRHILQERKAHTMASGISPPSLNEQQRVVGCDSKCPKCFLAIQKPNIIE